LTTSTDRIPTNLRTLLILEVLGKSDQPLTATQINEHLDLPKQTVHRLCTTLEENGFISRRGKSRRYQVARRLRELGVGLLHNSSDHIARRQILQEIASQTRETVNFVVPENSGMKYLDRVETDWAFRIQLPIGSNVPFHCTASGKCFLASLPPKACKTMVATLNLEEMTQHTLTDPEKLLAELAQIRREGFSLDREEFMEGMVALSVPVTDSDGRFVAALAVHGPTQRMSIEETIGKKQDMFDAARKLRSALMAAD